MPSEIEDAVAAPMNATFVSATADNSSQPLSPRSTYVIPKDTAKQTKVRDGTFYVSETTKKTTKSSTQNNNKKLSTASIMTEDDSDPGSPIQQPFDNFKVPKAKNTKELFKYVIDFDDLCLFRQTLSLDL